MWNYISSIDVSSILQKDKPSLIFKHSNRCSISFMALNRVLKAEQELNEMYDVYLVDVVANRPTSLDIASALGVQHESPQAIVINHGEVILSESHGSISTNHILSAVK
jgi:bacillithiol system protein YtxJ